MRNYCLLLFLLCSESFYSQVISIPDAYFKNRLVTGICVDSDDDGIADINADTNNDGQIQLSEALAVTHLSINSSNIKSLSGIENFKNLLFLNFSHNLISTVDLTELVNLQQLYCSSNKLTSLNLNTLINLQKIDCNSNKLTFLDVTNQNYLTSLQCGLNSISALFLKKNNTEFPFTTLFLSGNNSLTHICANTVDFPLIQLQLSNMQVNINVLDSDCDSSNPCGPGVICIHDAILKKRFTQMGSINWLDTNQDKKVQITETQNITTLSVATNTNATEDITNLAGLEKFPNLQTLYCNNNNLGNVDFTIFPSLIFLDTSNNKLVSVKVDNMPNLKHLICKENLLTELNLAGNSGMLTLNCSNNNLNTINAAPLTSITDLNCSWNSLDIIDVSNLNTLKQLIVSQNSELRTLYLNGLPNLEYITASNTKLSHVDLTSHTKLKGIIFENVPTLVSLDVSGLPKLTNLSIQSTSPAVIDLSASPLLNRLNFSYAYIDYMNLKNGTGIFSSDLTYVFADVDYLCLDPGEVSSYTQWFNYTQISTNCNFGNINNTISGNFYLNLNNNCAPQGTPFVLGRIVSNSNYFNTTFTNSQGNYTFNTMNESITVTPVFLNNYFTATPASYSYYFPSDGTSVTADFCIQPNGIHYDLEVNPYTVNPPNPGFETAIHITYKNNGNQITSGTINLLFDDPRLDYFSAIPNNTIIAPGNLSWNFANLMPFESRTIKLLLNVNSPTEIPAVNINDVLEYTVTVTSNQPIADENPADNTVSFKQIVMGSYDPNDKTVLQGAHISLTQAQEYLHYVVRFQNTGNAPAQRVRIEDLISSKLDISTLQIIEGSHPYRASINGRNLEVYFDNIMLPALSQNSEASQGYIAFKIKPLPGAVIGDKYLNSASIFFDFNTPIITNTTITSIVLLDIPQKSTASQYKLYPNPASDILHVESINSTSINSINIFNGLGQLVQSCASDDHSARLSVNVRNLQAGNYVISIFHDKGVTNRKFIKN